MPTREFAFGAVLSQFDKRDSSGGEEHEGNDMSLGEILAIVIAALTLLVAMIPLFRCPRFHRWVSSSISPLVEVSPPFSLSLNLFIYAFLTWPSSTESSRHCSSKLWIESCYYHREPKGCPSSSYFYTSPCHHLQRLFQHPPY